MKQDGSASESKHEEGGFKKTRGTCVGVGNSDATRMKREKDTRRNDLEM